MARQGYISEFMNGGRILSHGKIENLADGFSLPNDALFSIYIRPKLRLNTASSVMFIASKGKTVFKFLNDK